MCITWGRFRNVEYEFFYNDKKLECVEEFTYLGIVFTKKGLTNKTVTSRETASKKAMFFFTKSVQEKPSAHRRTT